MTQGLAKKWLTFSWTPFLMNFVVEATWNLTEKAWRHIEGVALKGSMALEGQVLEFTRGQGALREKHVEDALGGLCRLSKVDHSTMASGVPNALMRNSNSGMESVNPFIDITGDGPCDTPIEGWKESCCDMFLALLNSGEVPESWAVPSYARRMVQ